MPDKINYYRLEAALYAEVRKLELNSRTQSPTTSERAVYAKLKYLCDILEGKAV